MNLVDGLYRQVIDLDMSNPEIRRLTLGIASYMKTRLLTAS